MNTEAKNLEAITKAMDDHDERCVYDLTAVVMSPFEHERLGWNQIRGVPVKDDPEMQTGRFRLECAKPSVEPDEVDAVFDKPVPVHV